MNYALMISDCVVCKRTFSFNPHKVPSLRGQPICKNCIEEVNRRKEKLGMPPFVIPEGAYEAIPEDEL